jgi:hypothetical protein
VSTESQEDKAARRRFETRVGVTLLCIVTAVAIIAVFHHLTVAEGLWAQQVATEDWQSYQYKNIQRHETEIMGRVKKGEEAHTLQLKRLQQEQQQTQRDAQKAEASRDSAYRKASLFRIGQAALEVALVPALLAIFIRREILWTGAVVCALAGIAVAAFALWS